MHRIITNIRPITKRVSKNLINKNIVDIKKFYSNESRIVETLKKYNTNNLNEFETFLKYSTTALMFWGGFTSIPSNHVGVIFRFGKYDGFLQPGLRWTHPYFINNFHKVYCGDITINFDKMNITDSNKNPIVVSSYITYQITDPIKNILNVQEKNVINNFLESKFREYISKYSYNELTANDSDIYNSILIKKINENEQIQNYGIEVVKTGILQMNYSSEIAEMMLVKQKAKATIEARKEIIDVTLNLIDDISNKLDKKLLPEDKSKLITYLTVSMVGQNAPSNVINMN